MKKIVANFMLIVSMVLLLGHSVFPHHHSETGVHICEISDVKDPSFFDILKHTMANDLGSNHLEEYNRNHQHYFFFLTNTDFISLSEVEFFDRSLSTKGSAYFLQVGFGLHSQGIFDGFGLRAPPICTRDQSLSAGLFI